MARKATGLRPIPISGRVCSRCKIEKPAEAFSIMSSKDHRPRAYCNECVKEIRKEKELEKLKGRKYSRIFKLIEEYAGEDVNEATSLKKKAVSLKNTDKVNLYYKKKLLEIGFPEWFIETSSIQELQERLQQLIGKGIIKAENAPNLNKLIKNKGVNNSKNKEVNKSKNKDTVVLTKENKLNRKPKKKVEIKVIEETKVEAKPSLEEQFDLKELTPYEYFKKVKDSVKEINNEDLTKMYTLATELMDKYKTFGQEKAEKKLAFHLRTLLKESNLIELGINKFVYKDDIINYIDKISNKPVKIIEMKNYPREIPDDMIDIVSKTKNIFDEFYILFTDYTDGELLKEVEKERDPIMFGGFCTKNRDMVAERFYYLGDWIDEYCDLTLDKLMQETSKDIVKTISIPKNKEELIAQLNSYEEKDDKLYMNNPKKPHFFSRILNVLKREK